MFKRRLYGSNSFGHAHRICNWIRTHKKASVAIAIGLVLLIAGGIFAWYKLTHNKPMPLPFVQPQEKPKPKPKPRYYSRLTGVEVTKAESRRPVTAIMIENSPDARPQSGVVDAGVVFEAIAEGGITRYLCLYQESQPGLIGPVRSLRPYYLSWATAFDPTMVHIGGSANALSEARGGGYKDADQFFNPDYFWRATDRYAPHNVYTDFKKLDALNKAKGYTKSNFTSFERKREEPSAKPNATKFNVNVSSALYNSSYAYHKKSNSYSRSLGGQPDIDRETKRQLKFKTVVVMKIPHTIVFEDGHRESLSSEGSGEAWIFQDGVATHAKWHKPNKKTRITFTAKNKPVKLNAGQTWLTAIPTDQSVTWSAR